MFNLQTTKHQLYGERVIIFWLVIIVVGSFLYLGFIEKQQSSPQGWWTVYFSDPKSEDLSFTIENYTHEKTFHYSIFVDSAVVAEEDIAIGYGEKKQFPASVYNPNKKRTTIEITDKKKTKKEIYKNLR